MVETGVSGAITMIEVRDKRVTLDGNFTPGHKYEVVVRAVGPDGTEQSMDEAARNTIVIRGKVGNPAPPTSLSASGFLNSVALSWTNPLDYDFDHVEVWRSLVNDIGPATMIATASGVTYIDVVGAPDLTYYYWVRAVNTSDKTSDFNADATSGVEGTSIGVKATDIDDFSVSATKMFTNTIILTGDVWTNNSPVAGSVAWNSHYLVYGGAYYAVAASNTALRYVYWDVGSAGGSGTVDDPYLTTYSKAAVYTHAANRFVVVVNEGGVVQKVWNASANMVVGSAFIMDAAITNAKIADCNVGKLTAGTILSRDIVLGVTAGTGDCAIRAGKTDFTNTETGFILGLDDSDGDRAKFYIGDADNYMNWTGVGLAVKGTFTIVEASGYGNISDKPSNLAGINAGEGSKLTGIETGADVTATHTAAAITGQGALATQNTVAWTSQISLMPQRFTETIPPSGSGLQITDSYMGYYTSGVWKTYMDSSGNLVLGDIAGGNKGLSWNQGAGTLGIIGSIKTANSGARLEIFPDANTGLVIYDNQGTPAKVFEALVGGTDVGDVTIGDYASNKGLKYDKSAGSFTIKGVFHSSNGPSGGVVINDTNEIYVYNSTTPVFLVDYGISGVYTGISVRAVSANGGQFVAGNGADIINAPGDYAALCDGFIYVKRDDTDHDLLDLYYNSDSGTATLLKAQTGTTPVVVMELQSNGVLLLKNTMQLTSTSGGAVVAYTGAAWKKLTMGGLDLEFDISNVSKMTLDASGNLSVSAGTINASGGYKDNGTAGIDKTFSFDDNAGDTHSVVISGGIITQWNVA